MPTKQDDIEGVHDVTGGPGGLCALLEGGELVCISHDTEGDASRTRVSRFGYGYRAISGTGYRICAAAGDGTVSCRGRLAWREPAEQQITLNLRGVSDVDLRDVGGCALHEDGGVSCWGPSPPITGDWHPPARVRGLGNIVEIASGGEFTCARRNDGTVWCWGANEHGQLGVARGMFHAEPVRVAGIDDAMAIAAGGQHACALRADRRVWCWGSNDTLQVRPDWDWRTTQCDNDACEAPDGGCVELVRAPSSGPLHPYIRCPTPHPMPGLHDVTQIAPGAMCALEGDRRVMCWRLWKGGPPIDPSPGEGMPREMSWSPLDVTDGGR